jgi:uncharacterized membrane protein YphA (DoxX/SURF4 family)
MADVAVQPIAESPQVPEPVRWSLPQKLAFRFFSVYWLLYALPESGRISVFGVLRVIPKAGVWIIARYETMWHVFVPWVATRFFHVTGQPATYFRTGSGDTTLQYVNNLLYVLIALAAMATWSVLDRKRPNYQKLGAWLRLLVRYTLVLTLFGYGFAKVFPLQFQPPRNAKLMEPYGEFSPMGVLWSFMGASLPYTIYSGAAEVLGGLLMLFRRTTTLGAMVAAAVMLNVAALNYCYDTPVKLYSTNLILMAVFLFAWDGRRLANVLILNRPAPPSELPQVTFDRRWLRIGSMCFWVLFVGVELYGQIRGGWDGYKETYRTVKRPPLYGLYDVESGAPWRKVAVDFPQAMTLRLADDKVMPMTTEYAGDAVTLNKKDKLAISRPDPDHVVLTGTLNGAPATIRLKKIDTGKLLLNSRGFHWINEFPMNR